MRLKLEVSLDDAWAADEFAHVGENEADMLASVLRECRITAASLKIIDPNGNTIGRVEVEP